MRTVPSSEPNLYDAALIDYAAQQSNVVGLAGDSAGTSIVGFRRAHSDRFFNIGMAEQNMIGIAAGMARGGLVPFVHAIAVFLTRRPFDQLTLTLGYTQLPVRLIGGMAGLNPYGVSHQSIDDVALMRAIPGMTIIDLAEATEIQTVLPTLTDVDGPVYCRVVLNADAPELFDTPFRLGSARVLSQGSDLALISSAGMTAQALLAADVLRAEGVGVRHLHIATIRPLDDAAVLEAIEGTQATIVVENHLTRGGLGSAIAELAADNGVGRTVMRLGARDTYALGGTEPFLFERLGMDAPAIVSVARELLGEDRGAR